MDQGQPDAIHPLLLHLNEILGLEAKFQPNLQLPSVSQEPNEITTGIRDGSAHVLRCLKVWYDLPSEVLFVALNLMDRFLTKMKALPKHMACISVSTFHMAASQVLQHQAPKPQDLLAISQCKCTMGDLTRMEGIISGKLSAELPVTSLTFLRLFHAVLNVAAERLGITARVGADTALWLRLEILACDASCANFRPSEVALVLLMIQLNSQVAELGTKHDPAAGAQVYQLVGVALELQNLCKVSDSSFMHCHEVVLCILARYNAQCQMPYRQRLVWKLSHRTLRYLRPTDKLTSYLPTIAEHAQAALPLRIRSGSLCSEESCDSEKDEPGVEWSGSELNRLDPADWASSVEQQDKDPSSADSSPVKLFCDALAA